MHGFRADELIRAPLQGVSYAHQVELALRRSDVPPLLECGVCGGEGQIDVRVAGHGRTAGDGAGRPADPPTRMASRLINRSRGPAWSVSSCCTMADAEYGDRVPVRGRRAAPEHLLRQSRAARASRGLMP